MNANYMITSSMVTIMTLTETLTVPADHLSYSKVVDALKCGDHAEAVRLADAAKAINDFGAGQIYVRDGAVCYNDKPIHNSLTSRIMAMVREGFDVVPMLAFMDNLMTNPSGRAVNELYRFLESNNLPITTDGYFLAYKNVSDNYMDKHSGTFDNSIGSVCEMPRNMVMDDPNQTCSAGLHFCSIEYLKGFWGTSGHTMIIKINPADVVSIPVDYDNSKGRACKYEVIGEHMNGTEDTLSDDAVYEWTDADLDDKMNEAWQDGYDNGYNEGMFA